MSGDFEGAMIKGALGKAVEKDGAKQLDKSRSQRLEALAVGVHGLDDRTLEFDDAALDTWTDEDRFEVTRRRRSRSTPPRPTTRSRRTRSGEIAPPVFAVVPIFDPVMAKAVPSRSHRRRCSPSFRPRRAGLPLQAPDQARRRADHQLLE